MTSPAVQLHAGATDHGVSIELRRLSKSYGDAAVLQDVTLAIEPGEFIAIVGRSGCGKSTLLRLLSGLDQPTSGSFLLGGMPVQGRVHESRMMFQDSRLLPWKSVLDNVGLGLKGDWKAVALEALREVGLETRAEAWPGVLSGGQRQRVALARALVSKPRLLLLDEPLGALDALTRLEMQRLIQQVWSREGFTAVLVTHDVSEAVALADRVVLLDQGVIRTTHCVHALRPRHRDDAQVMAIEETILSQLLGG